MILSVLFTLLGMGSVAACGSGGPEGRGSVDGGSLSDKEATVAVEQAQGPVSRPDLPATVSGADGRTVTVESTDRIVVLTGNLAETVWAIGLGDCVVGRDISTTIDEAKDVDLVTRAHDVSAESVLSLRPTVVLADTDSGPPEALEHIRNVGVPVVVFDVNTAVEDIAGHIHAVGKALGVPDTAQEVAKSTSVEVRSVTDSTGDSADRPVVAFLYMRGQAGVYLMGGNGSGADSMITAAGGTDAGTKIGLDRPFTPITSEALVKASPDLILMTDSGLESVGGIDGLTGIPGIAQTPAGRDKRIATIEDGLLFGFGTRTPDALRHLAQQFGTGASTDATKGTR